MTFCWLGSHNIYTKHDIHVNAQTHRTRFINIYCAFHVLAQTNFRRYYFLLFARSSSNSLRSFQRFRRTLVPNFIQIQQRVENFPIDPIVKNARFRPRYNVAESGQFLQLGYMGKFFTRFRIWMKFGTRVRLKPSNERGQFEPHRARSKNFIGQKV